MKINYGAFRSWSRTTVVTGAAALACAAGAPASAQIAAKQGPDLPPPLLPEMGSRELPLVLDTGNVRHDGTSDEPQVVFATVLRVEGANWLRLMFENPVLSGDPAADGAYLRVTSWRDGGVQTLNAEHLQQWRNASAYFNGDTLTLEVIAYPGTGDSRLRMSKVTAGEEFVLPESICDDVDDRTLITDNRVARHLPMGCSSWMINDLNSMFLTAGHCGAAGGNTIQFNVPLSTSGGSIVNPPPQDQYSVDGASPQGLNGGVGADWGYFGVFANPNTGLTPYQAYGARYTLAASAPAVSGQQIRITGFGSTTAPVSPTWYLVEKTHLGPYSQRTSTFVSYRTDTTGGNSGSPVVDASTGNAIGIHTHGGCGSAGSGVNYGTNSVVSTLRSALNLPLGICASGSGIIGGNIYVSSDQANNFGTLNISSGRLARISSTPPNMQGLAHDWHNNTLYGVATDRKLYTIDRSTGAVELIGTITGTTAVLNGLAYDPTTNTFLAIAQANGSLWRINPMTLVASSVGPNRGGIVGALEWDTSTNTLYAINDSGGSKLISINTTDGSFTTIGSLGAGITDCNGLAYDAATDSLYTINATDDLPYRINKSTGAATVVGSALAGTFGSTFGMSGANTKTCLADMNNDTFVDAIDYDTFIGAFIASNSYVADVNGDGFTDAIDYDIFILRFLAGC